MVSADKDLRLLVMTENTGWQWGLGVEYVNHELKQGSKFKVLDTSFVGEPRVRTKIKLFFGGYRTRRQAIKYFKSKNIQIIIPRFSLKSSNAYFVNTKLESHPAFNTLVDHFQTTQVSKLLDKKSLKFIEKEKLKSNLFFAVIEGLDWEKFNKFIAINGRINKSATLKYFCKLNKIDLILIEGGNYVEPSFQIYTKSPHSNFEVQQKMMNLWDVAESPERENQAEIFFTQLLSRQNSSSAPFRRLMIPQHTIKFNEKKNCVFFASSEFEGIGAADEIPNEYFQNQQEALEAVLAELDPVLWDVYLRAHPNHQGSKFEDGEFPVWEKFLKHSNFTYLPPNSPVDSIALGCKADLIFGFGSTILLEFFARGMGNVTNTGSTPWNNLVPENYSPSRDLLRKFIDSEKKAFTIKNLYPWGYYQRRAGFPFELISISKKTGQWKIKNHNLNS